MGQPKLEVQNIMASLQKRDPHPKVGCDYGDPECMVGAGCMATSVCYKIACNKCDPKQKQGSRPSGTPTQVRAGSRRRVKYLGQSGTSTHRRMKSHRDGLKSKSTKTISVLRKHRQDHHDPSEKPNFRMEVLSKHRTVLQRLVTEDCLIQEHELKEPGSLMNSKGEYGRSKMIRFTVEENSC